MPVERRPDAHWCRRGGRPLRYIIYGAGAIGGTIGARLHEHGHDVVLIARGEHAAAMLETGLRIDDPDRSATLRIPVVGHPAELTFGDDDVVVLAVKGQDTLGVGSELASVAGPEVGVVVAQNGVENERVLTRFFRNVYGMQVILAASHLDPGVVLCHTAPLSGLLDLGRYPAGVDDRATTIATDLTTSQFSSTARPDIMRWKYRKLLSNLSNAIEAVCEPGPHTRAGRLATFARDEAVEALTAAGIAVASAEEDAARRVVVGPLRPVGGVPHVGSSSWQSLARKTGSIETDLLNGEIVLLGRLYGVPTPVNETLQVLAHRLAKRNEGPGAMTEDQVLAIAQGRSPQPW